MKQHKSFLLFVYLLIGLLLACDSPMKDTAATAIAETNDYREAHRNQYHFSPMANWMNDPNGMVYYEGEYHLFYQYYPDSTVWGPMHWGHAVSTDLVHWEHLPIALYPDSLGYIFSGSAVIDWNNTSGLGQDGKPPMIAIFTHHDPEGEKAGTARYQYQSIAYSQDKGRNWTKYANNPVLPNPGIKDFRDPKVIWHEASQQWVMVLAAYDKAQFYTSPNLIDWTFASEFGIPGDDRLWECPDLFPLQVEGSEENKWVLIVSIQQKAPNGGTATGYFVGDFDGQTFSGNAAQQYWADFGKDNYAMVTWSDIPKEDGRRLAMGWMSNWQYAQIVPTDKWRSAMTLPRVLSLHWEGEQYQMRSMPVRELGALEEKRHPLKAGLYANKTELIKLPKKQLYKMALSFKKPKAGNVGLRLSNDLDEYLDIYYQSANATYHIDRNHASKSPFSPDFVGVHTGPVIGDAANINWLLYLDHAAIELFADEGRCVMTETVFPTAPFYKVEIWSTDGEAELLDGELVELAAIWNK
ncbi:MAG: glycoside hydrolase family 32 protein [Bacteroidota bacterium]